MATTSLELNIEKFIVATNKRCKTMEDWQVVEEKSLEKEVTKAVKAYMVETGFADVKNVSLKKLYGADGNLLIEFDGLLSARKDGELFLVTVEAKHKVTTEKVQERIEQNNKLEALLSELRQRTLEDVAGTDPTAAHTQTCLVLHSFAQANAKVLHFIGGVHFSESDVNLAQKKFGVVTREGHAFHVTPCGP